MSTQQMQEADQTTADLQPHERRRNHALWVGSILAVLLVTAVAITWGIYRSRHPSPESLPAGVSNDGGAMAGILAADEGGTVAVEVYFDFLCPECKSFSLANTLTLNQLLGQRKIRLIWHPISFLDAQSNPPGYSMRAASAAGCAANASMNKMKAFGEALLAIQPVRGFPGYTDDQFVEIGGTVGLNAPSFAQCVRAVKYRDWVGDVTQKALQRGITVPLAIYVAGQPVLPTPEAIIAAVAAA